MWLPGGWDAFKFLIAYFVLCGPFALFGQAVLFWLFTGIFLFFVAYEFLTSSLMPDKKCLSERFWEFRDKYPKQAYICIGGMVLFWTYVILHFMIGI